LQNQAVSDTKYDLPLPKRFKGRESFQTVSEKTGSSRTRSSQTESFKNPFQGPADWIMAVGLLVFLVIIYFYTKDTMRTMYILVLTIVVALLFMIYKKALLDYE
jgi:L-asparagine transporter-like permease